MKVKTGLQGGRIASNHSRVGLAVKTGIKGGKIILNHSRSGLKVASALKGGRLAGNHGRSGLSRCGRGIKSGGQEPRHPRYLL